MVDATCEFAEALSVHPRVILAIPYRHRRGDPPHRERSRRPVRRGRPTGQPLSAMPPRRCSSKRCLIVKSHPAAADSTSACWSCRSSMLPRARRQTRYFFLTIDHMTHTLALHHRRTCDPPARHLSSRHPARQIPSTAERSPVRLTPDCSANGLRRSPHRRRLVPTRDARRHRRHDGAALLLDGGRANSRSPASIAVGAWRIARSVSDPPAPGLQLESQPSCNDEAKCSSTPASSAALQLCMPFRALPLSQTIQRKRGCD